MTPWSPVWQALCVEIEGDPGSLRYIVSVTYESAYLSYTFQNPQQLERAVQILTRLLKYVPYD